MQRLDETQRLLWRLITERKGSPVDLVRGDDRFGAAERVDVYAGMYFFRLLECLTEDFPALQSAIGHDEFHLLAADYLTAHPSEDPSVRMLGRKLGDFVERHPLAEERFWLADLARFEWCLLEAFDAPNAEPVSAERLAGIDEDRWPELHFTLTPSLRVLEASAPVDDLWSLAMDERPIPVVERSPTAIRIWREGFEVFHRKVEPLELAALRAIERGERFDEICETVAGMTGDATAAVEVARLIGRWMSDAIVTGLSMTGLSVGQRS